MGWNGVKAIIGKTISVPIKQLPRHPSRDLRLQKDGFNVKPMAKVIKY